MDDENILFATGYLILKRRIWRKKEREARKGRKISVREIYKEKNESGIYHNIVLGMALGDTELYFMYGLHLSSFYRYMCMFPQSFNTR